jgi:hypothetical protein
MIMADIINLRRARKTKKRVDDEKQAADNRIAFGQPKALKTLNAANKKLSEKRLDNLQLGKITKNDDFSS